MNIKRYFGYTLIELIVVVAILGILASIAVPQYYSYKERLFCTVVRSDLVNLALHQESYFTAFSTYITATKESDGSSNVPNHRWSRDIFLLSAIGDITGWAVSANHSRCGRVPLSFNSEAGGFQN